LRPSALPPVPPRGGRRSGLGTSESNARAHWIRALQYKQAIERDLVGTLLSLVESRAAARGDAPALIDEQKSLTYAALAARARAYAHWGAAQGLEPGEVVCLAMPNSAEYVAIWLGLTHIGCVVALLNTNLLAAGLAHSVRTSNPRHIIVARALLPRLETVIDHHSAAVGLWAHDEDLTEVRSGTCWPIASASAQSSPVAAAVAAEDPALLIFTSGTTGLPKAAFVTHGRILEWSAWFAGMMDAQPDDRLFNCLPMYHSVGGVVAVGAMLYGGGSVVIRRQFSASRFWADVADSDCTIFQYIGELCRYLARMPDVGEMRPHRLRLCCGNGLRAEVWQEFQSRFAIPRILEYYAATEGNVSLYNCEGKPGAIGRIPGFLAHSFPIALIRLDEGAVQPMRNDAGLCVACDVDEVGEAIGRIDSASRGAARRFDGYTDSDATSRKVLRDVFNEGDRWFRTGDLMRRDRFGYFYFVDRLGFSFRWKGENVSATEVASVIMRSAGVVDSVVYGVAVPGAEGRAGMAAVVGDDEFCLRALKARMAADLPSFARPLFIRLCRSIPNTSTFKLRQEDLAREGLDVSGGTDSLWFNDPHADRMTPYDASMLSAIADGRLRV
jgi:fatty-acyl-CoA synthase